jgi:hypothetical protein
MKAEIRVPKSERNPDSDTVGAPEILVGCPSAFGISGFRILSGFGFRFSEP